MTEKKGAVLDAPPLPILEKRLQSKVTGETPQPHPDANLWIRIDLGPEHAQFHCRESENSVVNHTILFESTGRCTVHIENSLITPKVIPLREINSKKFTGVGNVTGNGKASYYVTVPSRTSSEETAAISYADPRIFVP